MSRLTNVFLGSVLSWILLSSSAFAATYYVATTGSDANSCSAAQNAATAKRSINAGAGCLSAGDTLIVKAGTYSEILNNVIPSGTASTPTIVRSEVQYGAIIQPGVANQGNLGGTVGIVYFNNVSYITFDGFTTDGTGLGPVYHVYFQEGGTSHDITVQNNEMRYGADVNSTTDVLGVVPAHGNYALTIRGNRIHDMGTGAVAGQAFYSYGMYIHANNSVFENNEIYNCSGFGIHNYNTIINGSDGNIFRNNKIHNNGIVSGASGFLFADGGDNNIAYNNIVYGNGGHGIIMHGVGVQAHNNAIYNNTVYANGGNCIDVGYPLYTGPINTTVRNNICYQNGNDTVTHANDTGSIIDHNLSGTNPLFINAATADFHLQAGSPAIDAGMTISQVTTDKDGNARPAGAAYDMGAYEFGGSGLPAPTVSLTATSLNITSGQSSTLNWSSTNATSCSASGGWSGAQALSGSLVVSPTATTTYALTCTGSTGSASASVTVTVGSSQCSCNGTDSSGNPVSSTVCGSTVCGTDFHIWTCTISGYTGPGASCPSQIASSHLSVSSVDSQELMGGNYAATNAIDGNPLTFWHTEWFSSNPPPPHTIVLKLDTTYSVSGLNYLPRQDGSINGTVKTYSLYLSNDNVNWTTVVNAGTFNGTTAEQSVNFPAQTAGYIKFVALSEVNGNPWSSAAELKISGVLVPSVNRAPVLNPVGSKSVNENANLNFIVSGSDPDGNPLTFSTSALPPGATFNASTRTFNWTPTFSQAGSYPLTFTVSDGSLTASETITITINNVNRPPVLNALTNKTVTAGVTLGFTVSGSDPDGDALTFSYSPLLTGATFNATTGVFAWTPTATQAGTYTLTFTAKDSGNLSSSQTMTITVQTAPSITTQPLNQTVTAGQSATFSVVASGTTPLSYQWKKNGTAITGATAASYTTPATTLTDNGSTYCVYVTNSVGSVASNNAILTVQQPTFNFSLANAGNKSVTRGAFVSNTITATLVSGTAQSVAYSVSGLPGGVTASFSSTSCSPTCLTTLTLNASSSTPTGTFALTVTASGAGITKTSGFNLTVTAGLIGYWKFDETSGTTATDVSGNANTGTLLNAPARTTGKLGGALSFNGVNQWVSLPATASLKGLNAATVSLWYYPMTNGGGILYYESWSSGSVRFSLGHNINGTVQVKMRDTDGGSTFIAQSSSALSLNTWHHLAATVDAASDQLILYIDGVQAAVNTQAKGPFTLSAPADPIAIGAYSYPSAPGYLKGSLDDVRVYNRALTLTEIQSVMNGN